MKNTLITAALAAAVATLGAAHAQDYQFEGGVSYIDFSPDVGPSDSILGVDVTWHWDMVRTTGLPLAEAAFVTRAGNLHAGYATFDKADLDVLNLGAEFYVDRLYLAADYIRLSNGGSTDDFVLGIGFVPVDGLRLAARYLIADVGDDVISAEVKYVTQLDGGAALNLEGSAAFTDDDADTRVFSALADYYFNPSFSIGGRVAYFDDDFDSETGWGVGAKFFFTPTFSGELEYFTVDSDDVIGARLALRF